MKKKILVLLFVIFYFSIVQSQSTDILKVEYDEYVVYIPSIVNKYKGVVYASDDFSFYKTIYEKKEDKDNAEKIEAIIEDAFVIQVTDGHKYFSEVVTNRKTKELVEHLYEHRALKDYYSVYEKQPEMQWELLEGEMKINDYNCKKAQTTFRGRSYEVWYTPEIPISIGPWKFNGLPGLILYVKDISDEYYTWIATSVVYPYKGSELDLSETIFEKSDFTKISYQDFDVKFFDVKREDSKVKRAKVGERGFKVGFSYSTFQHKEPINEWRTQTEFEF